MIQVFNFSGTGHSKALADYFAEKLNTDNISMDRNTCTEELACTTAVIVFPVYCQNIPEPVKIFLQSVKAKYAVLIATYGKKSYGNVLYEAKKLIKSTVIAGACVPTGHTYLNEPVIFSTENLDVIFNRINKPKEATIPEEKKVFYADIFPELRSRLSVNIIKNNCCNSCGHCTEICPMQAMNNGKTTNKCIRCLRCVYECPATALDYTLSPILKKYLSHDTMSSYKIYL